MTEQDRIIVKTPTSTKHNPKTSSTVVGFDMNMTLQTTHHPPTGTQLWLWRASMAVQTNPIVDNHLRLT